MLDISTLQKFDTQGMYKAYDIWPQIAREQYEIDFDGIDIENVSNYGKKASII